MDTIGMTSQEFLDKMENLDDMYVIVKRYNLPFMEDWRRIEFLSEYMDMWLQDAVCCLGWEDIRYILDLVNDKAGSFFSPSKYSFVVDVHGEYEFPGLCDDIYKYLVDNHMFETVSDVIQ